MALAKYGHKIPGTSLALPEALVKEWQKETGSNSFSIKFPAKNPQVMVKSEKIQKFIESSLPFQQDKILRIPTEQEMKHRAATERKAAKLKTLREDYKEYGMLAPYDKMTDEQLAKFSMSIGLEVVTPRENKPLVKAALVKAIEVAILDEKKKPSAA